ncbi:MAG: ABC transporter permease subunit [Lachnospiraceae bacterium]|nr:ABC transporter permease subunit [Lachnospiraceae bacterium]
MIILRHELRQGRCALALWTGIIAFMLGICVLIYPEMESQMSEVSGMFADMGGFSAAFGMDRINFGEFMGYFGVECGNILGLGGSFFAALLGISALAKEEKEQTAEFLLSHPVSRKEVVMEKFLGVIFQIVLLNAAVFCVTVLAAWMVGESLDYKILVLLFLAYFLLQVETAALCFGVSAFISRGSLGIGLGLAALFYFLNIIANLTEKAKFLKYITPFGYAEGADIIADGGIDGRYLAVGMVFAAAGAAAAFYKYVRKDIA